MPQQSAPGPVTYLKMRQLIYVRENWHHMASVSGYDGLFQAISKRNDLEVIALDAEIDPKPAGLIAKVQRHLRIRSHNEINISDAPTHTKKPRFENLGKRLIEQLEANPDAHGLVASGESHFGNTLSSADTSIRARLSLCLHQPPAWHRLKGWDPKIYDGLSSIICVSDSLTQFMRQFAPNTKIHTHLHGVNTTFFTPEPASQNESANRLLFVGLWLRDFDCLAQSMQKIWIQKPDTTLDCVIPLNARDHSAIYRLASDHRVRWHAQLDAQALRTLYQQADLLFMPVIDATANNGIVEALACGLPIVSTATGGMPEYVLPEFGKLAPYADSDAHAATVIDCLESPDWLRAAQSAARKFAENTLNWDSIADNIIKNHLS